MTKKLGFLAVLIIAQVCLTALPLSATITLDTKNNTRSVSDTAKVTAQTSGSVKPEMFQDFIPGWSNNTSQDGLWTINGIWVGTGRDTLDPANITFTDTYSGESSTGFVYLKTKANSMLGSEIQTRKSCPCYGYGYYEVRMKVTKVGDPVNKRGVCASFFWKRQNYGSAEWDFEFLTDGLWITSQDSGQVTMNYHLDDERSAVHYQNLPFNPSTGFHRYGFLWQPNRLDWTVDGQIVYCFIDPGVASNPGYIMINSWTGNVNWGGNPPRQDAVTVYDWIKYYPNVTSIPDGVTE